MTPGMIVKLTKLSDDKFDGQHPNGINKGYEKIGQLELFEIGKPCIILTPTTWFRTSHITSIDEENGTFKTENSTYSIQIVEKMPSITVKMVEESVTE